MKKIIAPQYVRSPLKWAGGKYRLLPYIHKHLPVGKRLIEPFLGSAVVFLNSDYSDYLLNDINPDLINFYKTVQQQGDSFIKQAKKFFHPRYNSSEQFYKLRQKFNTTTDTLEKALLFLYLNRHGYNGLCRYNKSGLFNTPFGHYSKPYFPEKELQHLHKKSQFAKFTCQPYETVIKAAKIDDVIYCDPPYVALSKTASFTQYSSSGFSDEHQEQLASLAEKSTLKNIAVVISNHNTKFTRELYQNAKLVKFKVQRYISCRGNKRKAVNELLAIY